MARVVVDVMLKPAILDPQGQAVAQALPRLGFDGIADVRQGKRFELELEGEVTEERLAQIRGAAETLLSNPVIEDFTVRLEEATRRSGSSPSPAPATTATPPAPYASEVRRPCRCGTATTTSPVSTRSSCRAASPTATSCAAARSRASPRG
jgi:phosphoribosylformylglycinamidine synthase